MLWSAIKDHSMAFSKNSDRSPPEPDTYYQPLPPVCHLPPQPQYVIILLSYYNPRPLIRRVFSRRIICISLILLLAAVAAVAAFFLWPSDPEVSITRLHLKRFQVNNFASLDITLDLTIKVRNRDFFSLDYKSLLIAVGYRGKELGFIESHHGHVKARGSSYVGATLELDGVQVLADIFPLLEDLARGKITFDTETKIGGQLGLLFFELPLQGQASCEIVINIHNQTIEHQNCYPD